MRGVGSSRSETKMDGVKCRLRDRDRAREGGRERERFTEEIWVRLYENDKSGSRWKRE